MKAMSISLWMIMIHAIISMSYSQIQFPGIVVKGKDKNAEHKQPGEMIGNAVFNSLGAHFIQFGDPTALLNYDIDLREARLKVHKELFATIQTQQYDSHIEKGAEMHEQIVAQPADTVAVIQKWQTESVKQIDAQIGGQIQTGHNQHHDIVQNKIRL